MALYIFAPPARFRMLRTLERLVRAVQDGNPGYVADDHLDEPLRRAPSHGSNPAGPPEVNGPWAVMKDVPGWLDMIDAPLPDVTPFDNAFHTVYGRAFEGRFADGVRDEIELCVPDAALRRVTAHYVMFRIDGDYQFQVWPSPYAYCVFTARDEVGCIIDEFYCRDVDHLDAVIRGLRGAIAGWPGRVRSISDLCVMENPVRSNAMLRRSSDMVRIVGVSFRPGVFCNVWTRYGQESPAHALVKSEADLRACAAVVGGGELPGSWDVMRAVPGWLSMLERGEKNRHPFVFESAFERVYGVMYRGEFGPDVRGTEIVPAVRELVTVTGISPEAGQEVFFRFRQEYYGGIHPSPVAYCCFEVGCDGRILDSFHCEGLAQLKTVLAGLKTVVDEWPEKVAIIGRHAAAAGKLSAVGPCWTAVTNQSRSGRTRVMPCFRPGKWACIEGLNQGGGDDKHVDSEEELRTELGI